MEQQEVIIPSTQKQKSNFLIVFLILVALILTASFIYFGYQLSLQKKEVINNITPTSLPSKGTPEPIYGDMLYTWKAYTNNKYGFQIKYPSNLILTEDVSGLPLLKTSGSQGTFMRVDLLDNVNPQEVKLDSKWFQDFTIAVFGNSSKPVVGESIEEITIDNKSGIKVIQPFNDHTDNIFYLPWKTSVLSLRFLITPDLLTELPDQILSTFKFLDQNQTDETVNWETYSDVDGKYSIKLPTNWKTYSVKGGDAPTNEISRTSFNNPELSFGFGIIVKDNDCLETSLEQCAQKGLNSDQQNALKIEPIKIDEETGIKIIVNDFNKLPYGYLGSSINITTRHNQKSYSFTLSGQNPPPITMPPQADLNLFSQILSTFKFLN